MANDSFKVSVSGGSDVLSAGDKKRDKEWFCDKQVSYCLEDLLSADEYEKAAKTCLEFKKKAEKEIADEECNLNVNERRIENLLKLQDAIDRVISDKVDDSDVSWCYLRLSEAKDAMPALKKKFEIVHTDDYEKSKSLIKECAELATFFTNLKELRLKCEEYNKEEKARRKPIVRTMRRICQNIGSSVVIQNPTFTIEGISREELVMSLDLMRKRAKEMADFLKDYV